MKLSIIVPVFNEEESLSELHSQIKSVAEKNEYNVEIIFVDDGSSDSSWTKIEELAASESSSVSGIRFRRNFGKAAALKAGTEAATGDVIFTMDADLQDDPEEIPQFLEKMNEGYEVVSGWKKVRHDPFHKTIPSKVFNWLVSKMTGVKLNDHNCGFKCYQREVFNDVELYGERHRFIPVLAAAQGWKVGEVIVNHRARQHGVSKYGLSRILKGFLDLLTIYFLTGFKNRPQHLLGSIGIFSFLAGSTGMIWMAVYWVLRMAYFSDWTPLHQRPIVIYSLGALLLGAQLISIGFIAELITANKSQKAADFSVKQTTGNPNGDRPDDEDLTVTEFPKQQAG